MKLSFKYFTIGMIVIFWVITGCSNDEIQKPLNHDNTSPDPIKNVIVKSLPGGAKLSYANPKNLDFLYVRAEYEIRTGVKEEAVSSYYGNSLEVKGFSDTSLHKVNLYAVDRSGNSSEPKTVYIRPLISPVQQVYDSLEYFATFGGVDIKFKNNSQSDVVISLAYKDNTGDWIVYDRKYTKLPEGEYAVRGFDALPTVFGLFVKDRWDNHSDTSVKILTPLFEEEMDKSKFSILPLPGDLDNRYTYSGLWNDKLGHDGLNSAKNQGFPQHFQIDLGVKAKLSRFVMHQMWDGGRAYNRNNIKHFQLWGSNHPATDGSFDGWVLLGDYEIVKPSGLPPGQVSNEDVQAAEAGDKFEIPPGKPAVKYIRFNILSTFATPEGTNHGNAWLVEVGFWGQVK